MSKFVILKKRRDFLRAAKDITIISHNVMLQAARPMFGEEQRSARIGFTATKRLGKANVRNRIKRRLRAVVQTLCSKLAMDNVDYVLIGRLSTVSCSFDDLVRDMTYAFKKANKQIFAEEEQPIEQPQACEENSDVQKNIYSAD